MVNTMKLEIKALGVNEGFARSAVAAFALCLNPTFVELSDIKTAVSEAVTNSIVHAYKKQEGEQMVTIECLAEGDEDGGKGCVALLHDFGKRRTFGNGVYHYANVYGRFFLGKYSREGDKGFDVSQNWWAFNHYKISKCRKGKGRC